MAGWIDPRRGVYQPKKIINAMLSTMIRRGQDGQSDWFSYDAALGHCRKVISKYNADCMPWVGKINGTVAVIMYTGQIYNAQQLQDQLNTDGNPSDIWSYAELILHAYSRWGDTFVERLDGMFAIAIWDVEKRRLLLARDKIGLQPLYYNINNSAIIFASLPSAIQQHPRFTNTLDLKKLPIVLQPRISILGETPLKSLNELPPAHTLTFSEDGHHLNRFWKLECIPHTDDFETTKQRVFELLSSVIARQYPLNVRCGAMLSGGVDSTTVAALTMQMLRKKNEDAKIDTFCLKFDSDEEAFNPSELRPDIDAPFAEAAAEHLGTRHTTISTSTQNLMDAIPATRQARGLFGWGQFDASMFLLFDYMSNHCDVALTGEAADEIFGGYPYFFKPKLIAKSHFPWLGNGPKLIHYVAPHLISPQSIVEDEQARYDYWINQMPRLPGEEPHTERMREVQFLGMAGPLSVILERKERMSMVHGLEVRVPFCDPELMQYAWNILWEMKSKGGLKGLLKSAMQDFLPPTTVSRKKSAYPHLQDTAYDHALIEESRWIVNHPDSPIAWIFDTSRLNELIEQIANNQVKATMLPGGVRPAHLLIQLVEMFHWIAENDVKM